MILSSYATASGALNTLRFDFKKSHAASTILTHFNALGKIIVQTLTKERTNYHS